MPLTQVKVNELPRCSFWDLEPKLCRDGGVAAFDGRTIHGPWAYMCQYHFDAYGVGVGLGRGQKLVLR